MTRSAFGYKAALRLALLVAVFAVACLHVQDAFAARVASSEGIARELRAVGFPVEAAVDVTDRHLDGDTSEVTVIAATSGSRGADGRFMVLWAPIGTPVVAAHGADYILIETHELLHQLSPDEGLVEAVATDYARLVARRLGVAWRSSSPVWVAGGYPSLVAAARAGSTAGCGLPPSSWRSACAVAARRDALLAGAAR